MDYDLQLETMDREVWILDEIEKIKEEAPPVEEEITLRLRMLLGIGM